MKDLIKHIRESHKLTKTQFADLLGFNPSTVTRWEKGDRVPTGHAEIGALLRVADPDEQRVLLEILGIEDVTVFAADLLASANVQLGPPYQGYSCDTSDEAARTKFERKYGYPPANIVRTRGSVLAGPVEP